MLKVLFFIDKLAYNGFIGGAEKVLINLVNSMDKQKYDITIQTIYPEHFAILLDKKIHYKYCYSQKNFMSKALYRLESNLGSLLYRRTIKDDYDVEIAFLENDATKVMSTSANERAFKIAWIHCDMNIAIRDKESYVKKTKPRYEKYDKVVCVSERCKQSFDEIYSYCTPSIVLHNVINESEILEKANTDQKNYVEKRGFTIVAVGNFTPAKNYIRLLKTVKQLKAEGFHFVLWILGDGDEKTRIEDYIQENKLENFVVLKGFQENPYPYMKSADLLVCSSNYEGYSTFITEGIVLGKPIVTTDCSGMREILGESEYGLITSNDDASFYNGVKKMMNDNSLRQHYEHQAKIRAHAFSKEYLTKEFETTILRLEREQE